MSGKMPSIAEVEKVLVGYTRTHAGLCACTECRSIAVLRAVRPLLEELRAARKELAKLRPRGAIDPGMGKIVKSLDIDQLLAPEPAK